MTYINAYGCSTAAGRGSKTLMNALTQGQQFAKPEPYDKWPVSPPQPIQVNHWPETIFQTGQIGTAKKALVEELLFSWSECRNQIPAEKIPNLRDSLGVIFASTKGCIEDLVWNATDELETDSLQPVLDEFLARSELSPQMAVCVSNACSSSHIAVELANQWIQEKRVQNVLVCAADLIGPFISNGFVSLKAISPTTQRPFSDDREGLLLGDAAACLLLSEENTGDNICLADSRSETEGFAATRPSDMGNSLLSTLEKMQETQPITPDLIIAHGTATRANDRTEDLVFHQFKNTQKTPITAIKWSVGHTMGCSGALDIIAACEVLKTQTSFNIHNTTDTSRMQCYYLKKNAPKISDIGSVLITSMGFGGINAATYLSKNSVQKKPVEKKADNKIGIQPHHYKFNFPQTDEPSWSKEVDRWYQLDAQALALPYAYEALKKELKIKTPDVIYLASASASNETDFNFAQSGAISPAKFVHTLPNIRISSLLQIMGVDCPVYCLQAGQQSLTKAIVLCQYGLETKFNNAWIISIQKTDILTASPGKGCYEIDWLELSDQNSNSNLDFDYKIGSKKPGRSNLHIADNFHDANLALWLRSPKTTGNSEVQLCAGSIINCFDGVDAT